jgi:hypothetical protein
LLRPRDERPCDYDPRKKFDKFPPPHGFARAKGLDRVSLGYHIFGSRNCAIGHTPSGPLACPFGSLAEIPQCRADQTNATETNKKSGGVVPQWSDKHLRRDDAANIGTKQTPHGFSGDSPNGGGH